jgi:hypothetical protein
LTKGATWHIAVGMQLSPHMPRLSIKELEELRAASARIAAAHQAIALAKYANAPALLQLLYEANLPLDRVLQRCDGVIQRYLVKQGVIPATGGDGTEGAETVSQDENAAAERGEG